MKNKMVKTGILLGVSIFSVVFFHGKTIANNTMSKVISINDTEVWEEIKQENGVKVYYTLVEENGNTFLKLKFENTTNTVINFNWTLKNNTEVIVTEKTNKIEAGQSIEIYDATMLIPFQNGDSFQNYSILISKF
ncbi:MAG: hypothetical protein OQJ96_12530 [Flavobacteriales bacterium]|nr:hypothetical protein [Flavobacteriales bacterium]MCW8912845.1 hypothetical protein [Flavobacteriales bacterium]MCW8937194.1 hypothetical protein [Flavobacteriales bacterium]MCW8939538.1 hypothetical protein [Flavobacteriales bacterium]MCW8968630.1 hypothetical protein [Flavobacteriales bacterium]